MAIRQEGAMEPWRYNLDLALSQTTCVTKRNESSKKEEKERLPSSMAREMNEKEQVPQEH